MLNSVSSLVSEPTKNRTHGLVKGKNNWDIICRAHWQLVYNFVFKSRCTCFKNIEGISRFQAVRYLHYV